MVTYITKIPHTSWESIKFSFTKESIPWWALIASTSVITYIYDDDIYQESKRLGRRWDLAQEDNTKTYFEFAGFDILRLPTDTASRLYYLGDGWIHLTAAAAFMATGKIGGYTRAFNTGAQIFHGMIVSTIFSQAIKRSTGRESPNNRTEKLGAWRPFPSIEAYNKSTAKYDAVPSGHIMTATLSWTVIRENYPEYDHILFPAEIVYLTALGFGMTNLGVHWVSDYPLGIGIGYVVGKMAAQLGKKPKTEVPNPEPKARFMFYPQIDRETVAANMIYEF